MRSRIPGKTASATLGPRRSACAGGRGRAQAVQEDRDVGVGDVLGRLRIQLVLAEDLTHDRVIDEETEEEARREHRIDVAERALADAARDVILEELAQALDALLAKG